jgi:hypothetical protein
MMAQESAPITYEIRFAQFADTFAGKPEYVFIIGEVAFRSVDALKKGIATFPKGSILKWAPSCKRMGGEPLLSSEEDMADFKKYCSSIGIQFILVPSG